MARNRIKIKNKIALEASFLRKSSLEVCEVYVNLINFRLDI